MATRATLAGDGCFRPLIPLLNMLDDVPLVTLMEAVAGVDGNSLADCDLSALQMPADFVLLNRAGLVTLCDVVLEMAQSSPLLSLLPEAIEGIKATEFIGALIMYTLETPCAVYQLLNHPLNINGIRSKAALRWQLRYLKLLTMALRIVPRDSAYWYTGVIYRGVSIESNATLREKYENFKEAFKPGALLVFAAPTSATKDSSIAGRFTKGIQFVFQGDRPDKGPGGVELKAGDISVYEEAEVLISAPSSFCVVAATRVQDTLVVTLQVPMPCSR
jgi:hypothetical protein